MHRQLYVKEISSKENKFSSKLFKDIHYAPYRGLAQVTKWISITFAFINLKKQVIQLVGGHHPLVFNAPFIRFMPLNFLYSFILLFFAKEFF